MRMRVTIHQLEMTLPSQLVPPHKPHPAYDLVRVAIPCPPLNRFLYTTVGGDWYWIDRLGWSYAQWQAYLEQETVETWVAYVSGTPAGYFELDGQPGGSIEVAFFGLLPQFVGQGLGGSLLSRAVERAWSVGAGRVWVHTCSLDHPNALPGYQARGFRIFNILETEQEIPERPLGPWPGAYPAGVEHGVGVAGMEKHETGA